MAKSAASDQERVLTGELYGLKGFFHGGQTYEHLPIGTRFRLGKNEEGKRCIFARGREFPATMAIEYDAMQKSKPAV